MTSEQLAWAAGLFEGEGCIELSPKRLTLEMTDQDTVERFAAIVGVGRITPRPPSQPHHKSSWRWQTAAWEQVFHVLDAFYPWLCARRRERALIVLSDPPEYTWASKGVVQHEASNVA